MENKPNFFGLLNRLSKAFEKEGLKVQTVGASIEGLACDVSHEGVEYCLFILPRNEMISSLMSQVEDSFPKTGNEPN